MRILLAVAITLTLALAPRAASAQDYFNQDSAIQFKVDKERSKENKIVLLSLGGGAVLFGGIAGLFALHSQSQSDKVSQIGMHSGLTWSADLDDTRKSALRSRTLGWVSAGIGGALLISTAVYFIITDPGTETITLDDQQPTSSSGQMLFGPTDGGFSVGRVWSF